MSIEREVTDLPKSTAANNRMKENRTIKDWVLATRPWSFPASSMSVVTSAAMMVWVAVSQGLHFDWINAVLSLIAMVFFQTGGNLASDYHDYVSGVDKPGEESVQILTSGRFTKREVAIFSACAFAAACAIGLVICFRSSISILVIGAVGLLLAVFYYFLKYHALGDLCIFLEYAILPMIGTSIVTIGRIWWPVLLLAAVVGPVTVAILHANNARDIPSDRASGIKTFAMVIGLKASRWYYHGCVLCPYVLIILGIIAGFFPWTALLSFLALPRAIGIVKDVNKLMSSELPFSMIDVRTASLQLLFSLLLAGGFALGAIFGF